MNRSNVASRLLRLWQLQHTQQGCSHIIAAGSKVNERICSGLQDDRAPSTSYAVTGRQGQRRRAAGLPLTGTCEGRTLPGSRNSCSFYRCLSSYSTSSSASALPPGASSGTQAAGALASWLEGHTPTPPVVFVEGLPAPTALSWLRRRGPNVPDALLHKLFRLRQVGRRHAPQADASHPRLQFPSFVVALFILSIFQSQW